jgi:hypothetical protein
VDPITLLVSALAAGAASAVKETAGKAITDAYAALKDAIKKKYAGVDLAPVEQKPASAPKRASLAEDLEAVGAGKDADLAELAGRLLEELQKHDPDAGRAVGVDISGLRAASLNIREVRGRDVGVSLRDAEVAGHVDISGIVGGDRLPPNP